MRRASALKRQIDPDKTQKPAVPKIVDAENGNRALLPGAFRLSVVGPDNQAPAIHAVNAPFVLMLDHQSEPLVRGWSR